MRRRLGLAALFLLSLALRAAVLAGIEPRETLRADGWHYAMLGWSLANRGAYSDSPTPPLVPHMRWPPGYPLLLAPFYRGRDLEAGTATALRLQVAAGAAIAPLTVLLGARLLPVPLAWLAGVLAACCPLLVTTPSFPVTETVFGLLLLGWVLALCRLADAPGTGRAIVAGLLGAGLVLVRSASLILVIGAAAWLALRAAGSRRRRAAAVFAALALVPAMAWEIRFRIEAARGTPAPSYFARPLAEGIYPDLVYADSRRGYAMLADPEFPDFSTSIGRTLAMLWARARADPGPYLRWNLLERWPVLWEFGMIQSPPIHIYPVAHGLYRPAVINPGATEDEPLAPVYWMFRALWYWCIVPAAMLGLVPVVARRADPSTAASRARELCYVLLLTYVALHSVLIPEPRFLVPLRPLLFVLALAALKDIAARLTTRVIPAVGGAVAVAALAGWASAAIARHDEPAARRAAATLVERGRGLETAADFGAALAAYDEARAADPRNVEATMLAGLLYQHHLGNPARAVERYRAVLDQRPDHYGAHYQLATALLAAGRTAEARAAWSGFVRRAEAIGDRTSVAQAPPALRDVAPAR